MSAEEELYGLACQDMPVTGDEVRQAMDAWAHELAEKIRAAGCQEVNWCGCPMAADLIDSEVKQ